MMITKYLLPSLILVMLIGCSAQTSQANKTPQTKIDPARSLSMEHFCKDQAAHRYNTGAKKVDVTGFEQYQSGYELRGFTAKNENFVCSFDPNGAFLHLSMR